MKIHPTTSMEDQFDAYYSDLTTTAPDHVGYCINYKSDSLLDERISAAGLSCTGDLDHAAAKTINILSPVFKSCEFENGNLPFTAFDNTANKVFTKELLKACTRKLSNDGMSSFDEDLRKCLLLEKRNRLKSKANSSVARPTSTTKASVRFSTITIQEYPIQPGENPGGNKGCPLTIGWKPISIDTVELNAFEDVRCKNRRHLSRLRFVSAHREQILLGMEYSMRAIHAGTKAANLARRGRYQTISRLRSSQFQETMEDIRNKIRNLVTFGRKKRREKKLLASYLENSKDSTLKTVDSYSSLASTLAVP